MRSFFGMNARQNHDSALLKDHYRALGGVEAHLSQLEDNDVGQLRDYFGLANRVIWRKHGGETWYSRYTPTYMASHMIKTVEDAGIDPKWVTFYGHNEAGSSRTVVDWELAFGKQIVTLGGNAVLLNLGVGQPEPLEADLYEDILGFAADNRGKVSIGLHEYFPALYTKWETWLVGRFTRTYEAFRDEKNIEPIDYIITEFGADHILAHNKEEDLSVWLQSLPKTPGYHENRGLWSLGEAYKKLDPDNANASVEWHFWEQCRQAYEKYYKGTSVKAILNYGWGTFGSAREAEMDLTPAWTFQTEQRKWWAAYDKSESEVPEPTPDMPDSGPEIPVVEDPVEPSPPWRHQFTVGELAAIDYAMAYDGSFPTTGAGEKRLIRKLVETLEMA